MSRVSDDERAARKAARVADEDPKPASFELEREKRLLDRAAAGDRQALRDVLASHADVLYGRVILPRVGDVPTAEDILRATMVTVIEKLESFRWEGRSIYFWIRQIAVNKVIDHHRRNQRGQKLANALEREGELLAVSPTGLPSPERAVIEREEQALNRRRIDTALDAINPRYRQVIELRLIDEWPRETCAAKLGVSPSTFDVIFYRAIRAFRRVFGER